MEGRMMSVIYLSGVMSLNGSLPAEQIAANRRLFEREAQSYRNWGHEVINPFENIPAAAWPKRMALGLEELANADIIVMLPGWASSPGARMELATAALAGKTIRIVEE
jgi:hypothetical protein